MAKSVHQNSYLISYPVGAEIGRQLNAQVSAGGMRTERNATCDLRGMGEWGKHTYPIC
jgi:hypothetical protein